MNRRLFNVAARLSKELELLIDYKNKLLDAEHVEMRISIAGSKKVESLDIEQIKYIVNGLNKRIIHINEKIEQL